MSEISNLNPKAVWKYFDEICSIPHPSHKEAKLSKHLQEYMATEMVFGQIVFD